MTELALPTRRDEDWRYADFKALEALAPERFDEWKDVELAAGETRRKCMVLGGDGPELHRIRLTVGEGARAELFVVNCGGDYTRVEVQVRLAKGAHFQFGGVTRKFAAAVPVVLQPGEAKTSVHISSIGSK